MQIIYEAITITSSLCERTDYVSNRENCEKIAVKYDSYTKWYYDTVKEYEEQGLI